MPDNIRFSNPETTAKPPGYSHVVEVSSVSINPARGGQCARTNRHGVREYESGAGVGGAGFEHLVKINNYIVDIGANIGLFREIRDKY